MRYFVLALLLVALLAYDARACTDLKGSLLTVRKKMLVQHEARRESRRKARLDGQGACGPVFCR